jgi:hypothetical protein
MIEKSAALLSAGRMRVEPARQEESRRRFTRLRASFPTFKFRDAALAALARAPGPKSKSCTASDRRPRAIVGYRPKRSIGRMIQDCNRDQLF